MVFKAPLGVDHFPELVDGGYSFVDKSMFIAEVLGEYANVSLITRPRRFGKTLNLSMLQCFLDCRTRDAYAQLFDSLLISNEQALVDEHFGRYPVLFLTLKGIKAPSYQEACAKIQVEMNALVMQHAYLMESTRLSEAEKAWLDRVIRMTASWEVYPSLLGRLSQMLSKHWQQPVVILIDEYDAPIHCAWQQGYYEAMVQLMREFLGSALKGNASLKRAVLTGVVCMGQPCLLSDLSLAVHTPLGSRYGSCFGFLDDEVVSLLDGETVRLDDIRRWYKGYRMGDSDVYNPWSIVACLSEGGVFKRYWANTGDTAMMQQLLARAGGATKVALESMLQGGFLDVTLNPHMIFPKLLSRSVDIWYLMLSSGYLTADSLGLDRGQQACRLRVPNHEVMVVLEDLVNDWFDQTLDTRAHHQLLQAVVEGDVENLQGHLSQLCAQSLSFFDASGQEPERFYHAFVLGLVTGLQRDYAVRSNGESGFGRYDVMLWPKRESLPGVVIEFKRAGEAGALDRVAKGALEQVLERGYLLEFQGSCVSEVIAWGMAFRGKKVQVCCQRLSISQQK